MITFVAADCCMWPFNFQLTTSPSTRKKSEMAASGWGSMSPPMRNSNERAIVERGAFSSMAWYLQFLARRPMERVQWHGGAVSTKFVMADVIGYSTRARWCWGKYKKEFILRASKSSKSAGNDGVLRGRYLRAWSNMATPVVVGDNVWWAGCGKFRCSWQGSWRW